MLEFFFNGGGKKKKGPEQAIKRGGFLYADTLKLPEDTYRTRDGEACFDFHFCHRPGNNAYDIYLKSTPLHAYSSMIKNCPGCLPSGCINVHATLGHTSALRKYHQARSVAADWAEHVWNYMKSEMQQ